MASKRALRRKRCQNKIRHKTLEDAYTARRKLARSGKADGKVDVYSCKHCGGFHIGHRPHKYL